MHKGLHPFEQIWLIKGDVNDTEERSFVFVLKKYCFGTIIFCLYVSRFGCKKKLVNGNGCLLFWLSELVKRREWGLYEVGFPVRIYFGLDTLKF